MVFRDMRKFNTAMLCKQGWRLLKNIDTLVYQVLQAKYFLGKSFIETKQGHNSSFTWQSIWATKKTLEKGLRWRVENGHSIRIWKDPWITKLNSFIPEPTMIGLDKNTKVSELIDEDTHQWDMQKISDLFPDNVSALIQEIPIGRSTTKEMPLD